MVCSGVKWSINDRELVKKAGGLGTPLREIHVGEKGRAYVRDEKRR